MMTSLARILPDREPWEDDTDDAEGIEVGTLPLWVRRLANQVEPELKKCRKTSAVPGSPEKVAALAKRYAEGRELWHPDDRQAEPSNAAEVFTKIAAKTWKGVEHRHDRSWRANPWDGRAKKHIHLGYFKTREECVAAVRDWRIKRDAESLQRQLADIWEQFSRWGKWKMEGEFLTIDEAQRMLGVDDKTVLALVRGNQLRQETRKIVSREDVLDLIDMAERCHRDAKKGVADNGQV